MSTSDQHPQSAAEQTEDSNNSTIKRVNISMSEEHHDDLTTFLENRGTTFSGFVRRAVEARRHRIENDNIAREFQPLLDELEQVGNNVGDLTTQLDDLETLVGELAERNKQGESSSDSTQATDDAAEQVFARIRKSGEVTIPELVETTPLERSTIQRAIARLEADFAITELDGDDSTPAWEVR